MITEMRGLAGAAAEPHEPRELPAQSSHVTSDHTQIESTANTCNTFSNLKLVFNNNMTHDSRHSILDPNPRLIFIFEFFEGERKV